MNLLVIDVGTSSMRGILYNDDLEKLLFHQIRYCPNCNSNGEIEQPAKNFEDALTVIVKTLNEKAKEINSSFDIITITAQRSSVIPLDKHGRPLMNVMMWQDLRNKKVCQNLEKENDQILNVSGACVNTVFSGGKMAWIKQEKPEIFKKAHKFVNIPEYLIHLMTGEFVTDVTYGSRSNLMNLRNGQWDQGLLHLFGIREDQLCRLLSAGSKCGAVTAEFAQKTGIKEGITVITAGGDQQCAAVGQGIFKDGKMSIVTGTGAFLITSCDQVPDHLTQGIICNSSAVKGKYILETNILACCSAFDWFCRNFYDSDVIDYEKINQKLEASYHKKTPCLALPYFQGRSTPDWNAKAKASLFNISLSTTREDLLKAILEGIFIEIKNNIDLLKQYAKVDQICISGGLTNSQIMNQMQADIYGASLYHIDDSEATARGALMVTLVSLGIYSSYDKLYKKMCRYMKIDVFESKEETDYYINKQNDMNLLYQKIYK